MTEEEKKRFYAQFMSAFIQGKSTKDGINMNEVIDYASIVACNALSQMERDFRK